MAELTRALKVTVERPLPLPDSLQKSPRRKEKAGVRLKRDSRYRNSNRSIRSETPSFRWNLNKGNGEKEEKPPGEGGRRTLRVIPPTISARKLAAGLWRLFPPEFQSQKVAQLQFSDMAMEGKTKWDADCLKQPDEMNNLLTLTKPLQRDNQAIATKIISSLNSELKEARMKINELETEQRHSKKVIKKFLQKVDEERTAWRSRAREKIHAVIDDAKANLMRERKNHQRLEMINAKLIDQLADAKLLANCYMQEYEKERKAREMVEEVCGELVKEIGDSRMEMKVLKRKSRELLEEVEEERRMLQMAEVWREERVQMKLIDAKVMLEEKYSQMNKLLEDLESFMKSHQVTLNMEEIKKMESLKQMTDSVNIEDVRELAHEPSNPDDIFCVFDDVNFGGSGERELVSSCGNEKLLNEDGTNQCPGMDKKCELEEDASEWETVSRRDDEDSSYSSSDPSVSKTFQVSSSSLTGTEGEKEVAEDVPSVSKLSRSCPNNVENYKIHTPNDKNEKLLNSHVPQDMDGQSSNSSPNSGNPHLPWALKGCIEWPCSAQKSSSKTKMMEVGMVDSEKIQLRHVLKQKI